MIKEAKEKAKTKNLPLRVMFQDEARFGRINDIKKCWAPAGIRPEVVKQTVREYTYAYGAVSPLDGKSDFLILPDMNRLEMNMFLEEVSKRHSEELILMFMDQAPSHNSLEVPHNMIIENIPAYSPQLNPTENIWDEMREKHFGNLTFDSMDAVIERLIDACLDMENNQEKVKSITGFNWITVEL